MLTALVFAIITALVLLFLFIAQKFEIKSVTKQLRELKNKDTNELVHTVGAHKELIGEINSLLRETRENRIDHLRKNHAVEQMMTNISHDLRTPLTSAMGYIQIIQNSDLSEDEKSRELAIIEQRLIRLEELINSFFEFSQIISGGKTPEKETVNLIAILEESVVHYYDDYQNRNRKIILDRVEHKLPINSNKNMLLRIFDNLISNALKHGEGDLSISVNVNEDICVRFENNLSDPNVDISHIFDEFYTTDISRTKGNTGLGLAIAKQFTEMLGGSVSARNADGRFEISLSIPAKKGSQ